MDVPRESDVGGEEYGEERRVGERGVEAGSYADGAEDGVGVGGYVAEAEGGGGVGGGEMEGGEVALCEGLFFEGAVLWG